MKEGFKGIGIKWLREDEWMGGIIYAYYSRGFVGVG